MATTEYSAETKVLVDRIATKFEAIKKTAVRNRGTVREADSPRTHSRSALMVFPNEQTAGDQLSQAKWGIRTNGVVPGPENWAFDFRVEGRRVAFKLTREKITIFDRRIGKRSITMNLAEPEGFGYLKQLNELLGR